MYKFNPITGKMDLYAEPSDIGSMYETYLIENTTNSVETVESNWSVLQDKEEIGQFKVTVTVRDKVSGQIITLISILSFDYSDATGVEIQDPILSHYSISLDVLVDLSSKKLCAKVYNMSENAKQIFFVFERVVMTQPAVSLLSKAIASGVGYTPHIVPLAQIDGRLVFEVPFAVDLAQDTLVVEGKFTHTPGIDYTVTNVAGKGNFTFTIAPTEQLVIRYIKK